MEHRLMIVGTGNISRRYLEAAAHVPGMIVVAAVGRDAGRTRSYATEQGIAFWGTDLAETAKRSKATMTVICTPNALHDQGVFSAANAGLHILCEKPLHIDPSRQKEMVQHCRLRGVKLGISFLYRFLPHIASIRKLVSAGVLGKLLVLNARMLVWREARYYSGSSWHGTPEIDGGGPFIQQASHLIDLALWIGCGYTKVLQAKRFTLLQPISVEDHGYALVRYGNGAVGMIEASTVARGADVNELELIGTEGSLVTGLDGIHRWDIGGTNPPEPGHGDQADKASLFQRLLEDFAEAVESDRDPFIDGTSACMATELITEIYRSSGAPLDLRA